MDRLTKTAHFLPFRVGQSTESLAEMYMKEIVRLHGVPSTIVSDRDTRFRSHFWDSLQQSLGTRLKFSSPYCRHLLMQSIFSDKFIYELRPILVFGLILAKMNIELFTRIVQGLILAKLNTSPKSQT